MSDYSLLEMASGAFKKVVRTRKDDNVKIWQNVKSPVFVTVYFPATDSRDIYCCMSNGLFSMANVINNISDSSRICRDHDTRHVVSDEAGDVEITVLRSRESWVKENAETIRRDRCKSIAVLSGDKVAVFLPSVWKDNPTWTSKVILANLRKKARIRDNEPSEIYSIGNYVMSEAASRDFGYFSTRNLSAILLRRCCHFYKNCLMPDGSLAYEWTPTGLKGDNEGVCIRSLSDIVAFHKLDPTLAFRAWQRIVDTECAADTAAIISTKLALGVDVNIVQSLDSILAMNERKLNKSFSRPQSYIVLAQLLSLGEIRTIDLLQYKPLLIKKFEAYEHHMNKNLQNLVNTDSAFAANWLAQAKSAISPFVSNVRVQDVVEFLDRFLANISEKVSTTELACAIHGRASLASTMPIPKKTLKRFIRLLFNRQSSNGGFSYNVVGKKYFRLDVTSHVVQSISICKHLLSLLV
jgi:hypothetical protein